MEDLSLHHFSDKHHSHSQPPQPPGQQTTHTQQQLLSAPPHYHQSIVCPTLAPNQWLNVVDIPSSNQIIDQRQIMNQVWRALSRFTRRFQISDSDLRKFVQSGPIIDLLVTEFSSAYNYIQMLYNYNQSYAISTLIKCLSIQWIDISMDYYHLRPRQLVPHLPPFY